MALRFNGTEVENVYFNGTKVERAFFNNTLVYESTIYIDKPTVTGSYIFANAIYEPEISGYDKNQLTIGGITSARNAGTYTVTFTPKKGFAWKDGTTSTVSYTWEIAKRTIAIPSLSATSFTWVEGTTHAVTVNNLDSTYVNQSGTASQTDSSSNIGTNNTVTWSLKFASDTVWTDGTNANKTASWSAKWVDGTSHYKNDFYNRGWNSGMLGFDKYTNAPNGIDWGSASKPYITKINQMGGNLRDGYSAIYVKSSAYLYTVRWDFEFADGAAHSVSAKALYINDIGTGSVMSRNYGNSESMVTAASGTVYGNTKGDPDYWPSSDSAAYPCFKSSSVSSTQQIECHITRIYHT